MSILTIDIVGIKPLIQHSERLANPLHPITQELRRLTTKRQKTEEDYRILLPLEAYGGCWENAEGFLCIPTGNVWKCLFEAATAFKLGKSLKRALLYDPLEAPPVRIDGSRTVKAHDYVYMEPQQAMFIRTVNVNGRRTLRARPIIRQWASTHTFTILDDVLNPNDLPPVLERAGRLIGLGEWRPLYGTFSVSNTTVERG